MRFSASFALAAAVTVTLTVAAATTARATTPRGDGHDRALVARLGAKVATFQAVVAKTNNDTQLQQSLKSCAPFDKSAAQEFAAAFALLPALLIDVVNQYKPQLTDLRDTLAGMHPHAPLFRQWLAAESQNFSLILQFDNHGRKVDYCQAAKVLVNKKSTAQDVRNALGIDPSLIAKLYQSGSSASGATLKRLNPQMRSFLVAEGLSHKTAAALTM